MILPIVEIAANRDEWLTARQGGIGASDAAAVLGMSRWKTNVELWYDKTGLRQPEDIADKPAVMYGNDAEPHLRALFALDHPELIVTYEPFKIIRNDEYPYIFATPDGELMDIAGRSGGLEIKTTEIRNAAQWQEWSGRIPQQYYCQIIHQMLATDWEYVYLLAQIKWTTKDGERRKDTREYLIEREDCTEDIDALREAAKKFWIAVQTKTRPNLILPNI